MKKITAGIISIGLCTTLLVAGIKTVSNVAADENDKIETVTLDIDNLEKSAGDPREDGTEQIGALADSLINSLLSSDSGSDAKVTTKEETVYVVADADGKVRKTIVSDWIKNAKNEDKLSDKSELTDIMNVKGDETFDKNGDECIWDAKGSDISYQGKTDKELPIEVKVSYELDGKKMSPDEIKGKSGHVVIRFDYENKTKEDVEVAGKKETMCIPFVTLTGVLLNDDKFTNITASNAKLINDGSRTVVIGIAFPGLQDNLAIDREKFNIPESLEISADVQDFSLAMSVTVASNEIFGKLNNLDATSLDNLSESMAELTDAMTQLTNGSEQLSDGLATLLDKSGELENGFGLLADGSLALRTGIAAADAGTGQLADGAGQLADGAGQLADGAGALADGVGKLDDGIGALADGAGQVATGAGTLAGGLGQLADGVGQLADGAGQLSSGIGSLKDGSGKLADGTVALSNGASQLADGAGQLESGAGALADGAGQLKTGLDTLASNNDALIGGAAQVFNTLLATVEAQLKEAGADIPSLNIDNYGQVIDSITAQLNAAVSAYEKADPATAAVYKEKAAAVAGLKVTLDSYNTFYTGLKTYTDGVAKSAEGAGSIKEGANALKDGAVTLKSGVDALKTGADGLKDGMAELNNGVDALKIGADSLKDGADNAKNGADTLKTGADTLKTGADSLKTGADTIKTGADSAKTGADSLKSGADSLSKGSNDLKSGIDSLKDGTGKLLDGADALNDGINELKNNIPALKDGVTQLYDGSVLLKDGIKEFNDRGIQKITELIEGELEGLIERTRVMGELSRSYNNFAGIGDEMDGLVKFIIRTEEIK